MQALKWALEKYFLLVNHAMGDSFRDKMQECNVHQIYLNDAMQDEKIS